METWMRRGCRWRTEPNILLWLGVPVQKPKIGSTVIVRDRPRFCFPEFARRVLRQNGSCGAAVHVSMAPGSGRVVTVGLR